MENQNQSQHRNDDMKGLVTKADAKEGDIAWWCEQLLARTRHAGVDPWGAHMAALCLRDRFAPPQFHGESRA